MLREEVIKVWKSCKNYLLSTSSEIKEYKPLFLRLKNAEWKTLAYRVLLLRGGREYELDDIVSLWEWDNYYKIKSSEARQGNFSLPEKEKIVSGWKVLTAKYLVVKEIKRSTPV